MKIVFGVAILFLAIGAFAWMTYPWEYDEAETEAAFQKIARDGFDRETALQLIKEYRVSDASFRTHFLAFGYFAKMKNKVAFDTPLNKKWMILVKDIAEHGELAAEDWFGPKKCQELKDAIPTN